MDFEENAVRDENSVAVIQGVSQDDGATPVNIAVNSDSDGAGTHGVVCEIA